MSFARRVQVSITTSAGGAGTGYSVPVAGRVLEVLYDGGFDAGADITVTTKDGLQSVLAVTGVAAAAASWAPRRATHSTAGAAALYAAGGTAVLDHIYAAEDELKVVIASGGNTKTGTLTFIVG